MHLPTVTTLSLLTSLSLASPLIQGQVQNQRRHAVDESVNKPLDTDLQMSYKIPGFKRAEMGLPGYGDPVAPAPVAPVKWYGEESEDSECEDDNGEVTGESGSDESSSSEEDEDCEEEEEQEKKKNCSYCETDESDADNHGYDSHGINIIDRPAFHNESGDEKDSSDEDCSSDEEDEKKEPSKPASYDMPDPQKPVDPSPVPAPAPNAYSTPAKPIPAPAPAPAPNAYSTPVNPIPAPDPAPAPNAYSTPVNPIPAPDPAPNAYSAPASDAGTEKKPEDPMPETPNETADPAPAS